MGPFPFSEVSQHDFLATPLHLFGLDGEEPRLCKKQSGVEFTGWPGGEGGDGDLAVGVSPLRFLRICRQDKEVSQTARLDDSKVSLVHGE